MRGFLRRLGIRFKGAEDEEKDAGSREELHHRGGRSGWLGIAMAADRVTPPGLLLLLSCYCCIADTAAQGAVVAVGSRQ